jgi:hypothetical protein
MSPEVTFKLGEQSFFTTNYPTSFPLKLMAYYAYYKLLSFSTKTEKEKLKEKNISHKKRLPFG